MKIKIFAAILIVGVLIAGGVAASKINFNRVGAKEYYTKIVGAGEPRDERDSSGEHYTRYEYSLDGYEKDGGQMKRLDFMANKQLREGAYLKVYVKETKGVTSYQEVQLDEIPDKIGNKL